VFSKLTFRRFNGKITSENNGGGIGDERDTGKLDQGEQAHRVLRRRGVSTESGIPDFRSVDGLYNQQYDYPPETILSHTFFMRRPEEFFRFYRNKMLFPDARPNAAHTKLAQWEAEGKLTGVVTQNIDGLHQKAGSKKVYELHGSVLRNYCMRCGKFYDLDHIMHTTGVPKCECGGTIKPDVVLYEESLDNGVVNGACAAIEQADMMIIGGTSLNVYPAAGLVDLYRGNRLVLVNLSSTPQDGRANLVIHERIGQVFADLP
jgi:NAD-dependent deacetylase